MPVKRLAQHEISQTGPRSSGAGLGDEARRECQSDDAEFHGVDALASHWKESDPPSV